MTPVTYLLTGKKPMLLQFTKKAQNLIQRILLQTSFSDRLNLQRYGAHNI